MFFRPGKAMFCNMAWWVKMPAYITRVKTLTAKEWLILQLLSSGEINVDSATQLNRSEKDIIQHIKNIERQLQVESMTFKISTLEWR